MFLNILLTDNFVERPCVSCIIIAQADCQITERVEGTVYRHNVPTANPLLLNEKRERGRAKVVTLHLTETLYFCFLTLRSVSCDKELRSKNI